MSKFKVGDRVRMNVNAATAIVREHSKTGGHYPYLIEFESNVGFGHDGNGISSVRIESGRGWWCSEGELTAVCDGPVRTVTRRKIVPGNYGRLNTVNVGSGGFEKVPVGMEQRFYDADDLREAAHLFNQIADVLEERAA